MRVIVCLVRALANDPPFVIYDEPTGKLDTGSSKPIVELFFQLVEDGKTMIIVTHVMMISRGKS